MPTNTRKLTRIHIASDDRAATDILRKRLEEHFAVEMVDVERRCDLMTREHEELKADLIFVDPKHGRRSAALLADIPAATKGGNTKIVIYSDDDTDIDAGRHGDFFWTLPKNFELKELFFLMTKFYESRLALLPPQKDCLLLTVNAYSEHFTLNIDDIAYFRFDNGRRQWEVVCSDGRERMLRRRTTSDVILSLSRDFVQIHKRYIVNIKFIRGIQDTQCLLNEPLDDVTELKISKNFRHELMNRFWQI